MSAPLRADAACLQVGVIGAGRVGAVLGAALRTAGHDVVGVATRNTARAEELLSGVPVLSPQEVADRAELLLLAVPDDALPGLVGSLDHDALVHVSGRHGADVLQPATTRLALHPVYPFSGGPADLEGVHWGVTATDQALAERIVTDLKGVPVNVPEQLRPLWHAALAHGANHLVTLVVSAAEMLRSAGAEDPGAVLRPLLTAALDGALDRGGAALTGPVVRGDAGTVATHLGVVPDRDLYLALARETARLAGTEAQLDEVLR